MLNMLKNADNSKLFLVPILVSGWSINIYAMLGFVLFANRRSFCLALSLFKAVSLGVTAGEGAPGLGLTAVAFTLACAIVSISYILSATSFWIG